jgi:hypothetical protein
MARKAKAPLRVRGETLPKGDGKSVVRDLIDAARGAGPAGIVAVATILGIAHSGRMDWGLFLFSLLVL